MEIILLLMKLFKNKKILVTGGAGFIGSHLVKRLVEYKAKVTVIVKYKSIIDSPRLSKIWPLIEVVECDLRNTDSVMNIKKKFDYIFHLAAYNHVGDSFIHVNESIQSNLISTINILNHGPKYKKFINIASSEVYGLQSKIPFDTKNTPYPLSPYALGKYGAELFGRIKFHQNKNNIIFLRPFNTFGPYQSEKAIIPELIIKCLLNKQINTTLGEQTREFNYVSNIIDAILLSCQKINYYNQPFNVGTNNPIKIKNLVKLIHKLTNSESVLKIGAIKYRPNEIWKMQAENKFLINKLGWEPKVKFEQGLINTIEWCKHFVKVYIVKSSSFNNLN